MANRHVNQSQHSSRLPPMSPHESQTPKEENNDMYLSELLQEKQKLSPFMAVLPNCSRLLNQEIDRLTALVRKALSLEMEGPDRRHISSPSSHNSPAKWQGSMKPTNGTMPAGPPPPPPDLTSWNPMQSEPSTSTSKTPIFPSHHHQHHHSHHAAHSPSHQSWRATSPQAHPQHQPQHQPQPQPQPHPHLHSPTFCQLARRSRRIDVPVAEHPTFNFVGRILGPRGNSLKRVEAQTGCRVLIRGKGSIKDAEKEDRMRVKPGFEHLNEPLHVIIEAELPATVIDAKIEQAAETIEKLLKPQEDNYDAIKQDQLRELALLNGTFREKTVPVVRGTSPFNNQEMKRAKTRR